MPEKLIEATDKENTKKYTIDLSVSYVEPIIFRKFANDRMITYCYSISYGRDMKEISRTTPFKISSVGYGSGEKFTESDYNRIIGKTADTRFLKNVFNKIKNWFL